VNNVTESIAVACNARQRISWSVLSRDGIFYAAVALQGADLPLEVALHGIGSESEAHRAVAALAQQPSSFGAS
jgi:hypothetical protein